MALTLFDIITLSIIAISSLLGLYRGFTHIIINFLGFIASIAVAIIVYPYVKIMFIGHISNELGILIVSGTLSYIASLILFTVITSKILLLIKNNTGGIFDRIIGLIAGFIRGIVFASAIFIIIAVFTTGIYLKVNNLSEAILGIRHKDYPIWLKESISANHYEDIAKASVPFVPSPFLESIKMPGVEKEEEKRDDEDIIDSLKRKKNKEGVSSSIDIQVDDDLQKSIDELNL